MGNETGTERFQHLPGAGGPHKEITNNFFTTYFMALYIPPLGGEDDVGEVLVTEESREDLHHVVLVVVPLEAVLLVPHLAAHAAVSGYHCSAQNMKILSLKTINNSYL